MKIKTTFIHNKEMNYGFFFKFYIQIPGIETERNEI